MSEEKYVRPTWDEYFMEVARTIAKRATCDRGRSGCVIARDNQILVTGYVGSPAGLMNTVSIGNISAFFDREGKERLKLFQDGILKKLIEELSEPGTDTRQMLVLDEALAACEMELVDEELVKELVKEGKKRAEIVLTGRNPRKWMLEEADYITQLKAERHPYEKGITARKGIEY